MTVRLPSPGFDPSEFSDEFVPFSAGEDPIRPRDYAVAAATWTFCISIILDGKSDRSTLAAAELRRIGGRAIANGEAFLRSHAFGQPARDVVDAARVAGMSRETFASLRQTIAAIPQSNGLAALVVTLFVRLCLAAEARTIAETDFVSRQDVDAAVIAMRDAFEAVLDYAAERHDAEVFQSFSTLYSDTIRDMTERSRALPRMISYQTTDSIPALRLACRLYDDAARAMELSEENKVVNPLFMPLEGRSLAF